MRQHRKSGFASRTSGINLNLFLCIVACLSSFFAGMLVSIHLSIGCGLQIQQQPEQGGKSCPSEAQIHDLVAHRVQQAIRESNNSTSEPRFPETVSKYATGMSRISKDSFTTQFELGVPLDQSNPGEQDVLLLYSSTRAHPHRFIKDVASLHTPIPLLEVELATRNCDEMHIVLTDHTKRKQCVAIVPQYESFHIQKWMRVDGRGGPMNRMETLKHISRGYQSNGKQKFLPPEPENTRNFWTLLVKYIQSLDQVLNSLRPLIEKVATHDRKLVVMVCNMGQSELLMNFVCNAKAHGVDYSHVLVFATDLETKALAENMGLTAFYDEINLGNMPSEAARSYGDRRFVAMMLAKVLCVHMVSVLGYDFLFQDVDIIWFKDPLEYFRSSQEFDIYFQDDGAHSIRYAPYSANSGFYFVRHNYRTQFFLTSVLLAGDLVLKTHSHQQALVAILSEHVSLYGLRAKILSRDMEGFPGGYHFNQKTGKYMRAFFRGEVNPYIFHMSWTLNKENKLLFFRQIGEWYLEDQCIQTKFEDIMNSYGAKDSNQNDMISLCCHAKPLVSCHYRDKPSVIPCHESPPIDNGKPSWWGSTP